MIASGNDQSAAAARAIDRGVVLPELDREQCLRAWKSRDARFDGQDAGWKVYAPGTAHFPTVTGGAALVLYLLPNGEIEFPRPG